jgi:hypothetical protein
VTHVLGQVHLLHCPEACLGHPVLVSARRPVDTLLKAAGKARGAADSMRAGTHSQIFSNTWVRARAAYRPMGHTTYMHGSAPARQVGAQGIAETYILPHASCTSPILGGT